MSRSWWRPIEDSMEAVQAHGVLVWRWWSSVDNFSWMSWNSHWNIIPCHPHLSSVAGGVNCHESLWAESRRLPCHIFWAEKIVTSHFWVHKYANGLIHHCYWSMWPTHHNPARIAMKTFQFYRIMRRPVKHCCMYWNVIVPDWGSRLWDWDIRLSLCSWFSYYS